MSRFDEELEKVRRAALRTAAESVPHLYNILVTEEGRDHNDSREILYDRLQDIWSRATIRRFLPDEAKDQKKSEAGKIGREKQLESARKSWAEQSPDLEKEQESKHLVSVAADGSSQIGLSQPYNANGDETQRSQQIPEDETLSDDTDDDADSPLETTPPESGELTKDERIAQLEAALKQATMFSTASEMPKSQGQDIALPARLFSAVFLAIRNGEKNCIWCTVEGSEIVRIEANAMRVRAQNRAQEVKKH